MTYIITWTYEEGRLVARDSHERLLLSAEAEAGVGEEIAHLLNEAPMLSRQLLPPVLPKSAFGDESFLK